MDESWFEPKEHGYGAVPSHWKGVALLVVFVAALLTGLVGIAATFGRSGGLIGIAYALALTGLFLYVCRRKTNGPWRWR